MTILQNIKKRITPYFQSRGFVRKGNTYYYIQNDISYRIAFEMPTGLIYVTAYIIPLYMPCEAIYYTYGKRLDENAAFDFPIIRKDATDDEIDDWCHLLRDILDKYILPFFQRIGTPSKLERYLCDDPICRKGFFRCPQLHIERLKAYTYLYLLDLPKATSTMYRYYNLLIECSYYTDNVRKHLLDEFTMLQGIMQQKSNVEEYLNKTIGNTLAMIE